VFYDHRRRCLCIVLFLDASFLENLFYSLRMDFGGGSFCDASLISSVRLFFSFFIHFLLDVCILFV
jgi:hypothetical protein